MKTICAWCGKHLKGDEKAEVISHGICEECLKKEEEKIKGVKS